MSNDTGRDDEPFVRLEVHELNRIAEAIAASDGEDFNQYTAARYRSLARAAAVASAGCVSDRLAGLPSGGRHTRATWMVSVLSGIADVDTNAVDAADEASA